MKNICEVLGGRADKDFLGTGNIGFILQPAKVRLLFVQQWIDRGLLDWASGSVRSWAQDRIELNEPIPPVGARTWQPPSVRLVFAARDDVLGMSLEWKDENRPNIAERYDPHTAEPVFGNLDYNHSSWIDLVVQHVAGLTPQETDELLIDPVDMGWESFSLTNVRYRNRDIVIEYSRSQGLLVRVDGMLRAHAPHLQKISLKL